MKRIILLISLMINFFFSQSQDEVDLSPQYRQETKYIQTVENNSQSQITYSGAYDVILKLKDKGVQNPEIVNSEYKSEWTSKTGTADSLGVLPLVIEYGMTTGYGGKEIYRPGTVKYGHVLWGNKLFFDSVVSNGHTEKYKEKDIDSLQNSLSRNSIPEKSLKAGEDFSQEYTVTVRLAGAIFEETVIYNYRFISNDNGIANFDVSKEIKLKDVPIQYIITMSGGGRGEAQYDLAQNQYIKYMMDTETETNLQKDNVQITKEYKGHYVKTTEITKQ